MKFTATCARGLEEVLADELTELGLTGLQRDHRAVHFQGELEAGYRACLGSRIATRVLLPLGVVYAGSAKALYAETRKLGWLDHLGPEQTLAIHFVGTSGVIRNSHFGALKVKDAIVDELRDHGGGRPTVDTAAPDVRVHVHLGPKHRATVSIDLSGDPLFVRGFQRDGGPAPLKETLAAAILRIAGWTGEGVLFDPMCGSGTFLVEAALIARHQAPGLQRTRWGFTGWRGHDAALWQRLVAEAREQVREPTATILGADRDPAQVGRARSNVSRAGVDVRIVQGELADAQPPADVGLLVTNPPYGERLEDEEVWPTLGNVLRRRFLGWTAWVLAGSRQQAKQLGLRPSRRIPVWNGPIEGRLLAVPIRSRPVARDQA